MTRRSDAAANGPQRLLNSFAATHRVVHGDRGGARSDGWDGHDRLRDPIRFTFVLAFVVLSVATTKKAHCSEYFGFAIGKL